MTVKPHECKYKPVCCCYLLATEPSERCPIHGYSPEQRTCDVCGRFMKREPVDTGLTEEALAELEAKWAV